jgi:hypothetical protein
MNLEGYLTLLVKLAAMAAIASIVARSTTFQSMLMRETRTLSQRAVLALCLGLVFAASVAVRIAGPQSAYQAADLGLEGSLIAGLLGGYVTGLLSGILISLPTFFHHEYLTLPLLASVGVLGGLLRDLAPTPEEVWRFSPYPDVNIYRFFKEKRDHWRTGFQLIFFAAILCAEALRQGLGDSIPAKRNRRQLVFCLKPTSSNRARPLARHRRHLCHHALRRRHPAEDLEQHTQREKARRTGALAGGSAPGGAHQPDQSALPVQYPQLGLFADSHQSQPGACHGSETFQGAAPPVAQT